MKAIVYTKYGGPDVLQLKEIAKPIPKDNEVLIKIHAVSLNAKDWRLMRAEPFIARLMGAGLLKPMGQILGSDIAGRVDPGRRFSLMVRLVVWVRLRCRLLNRSELK